MAAVSTQQSMDRPLYPSVTPELREQLAADRKRLAAIPEQATPPADLNNTERFLFRTKPGRRTGILYALPLKPEEASYNDNPVKYNFELRRWSRLVAQKFYPDLTRDEAVATFAADMEEVRDRIGDSTLRFHRVGRAKECLFATDDEIVAGFIRKLMAMGGEVWNDVYEESGRMRVVVGSGKDAKAFPNTAGGWNAARAHATTEGIEDIKLVKE